MALSKRNVLPQAKGLATFVKNRCILVLERLWVAANGQCVVVGEKFIGRGKLSSAKPVQVTTSGLWRKLAIRWLLVSKLPESRKAGLYAIVVEKPNPFVLLWLLMLGNFLKPSSHSKPLQRPGSACRDALECLGTPLSVLLVQDVLGSLAAHYLPKLHMWLFLHSMNCSLPLLLVSLFATCRLASPFFAWGACRLVVCWAKLQQAWFLAKRNLSGNVQVTDVGVSVSVVLVGVGTTKWLAAGMWMMCCGFQASIAPTVWCMEFNVVIASRLIFVRLVNMSLGGIWFFMPHVAYGLWSPKIRRSRLLGVSTRGFLIVSCVVGLQDLTSVSCLQKHGWTQRSPSSFWLSFCWLVMLCN